MAAVGENEVVAALRDPGFYPHGPASVRHVQTHISHVFLAGPFVYKLKKAVRFPFLDFGTIDRRRFYCEEEVRLNARLAPGVYLGVVPVSRASGGRLALGGHGERVADLVWMRRLPEERMLVRLLERDACEPTLMDRLATHLAAFHARAPTDVTIVSYAAPEALRARFEENLTTEAPFVGRVVPAEDHELLADFGPSFLARHETLLRARQAAGRICDGHGDLHAEHVCDVVEPLPTVAGAPELGPGLYVFDCIEFSPAFRAGDVASEVAFLAMDLERRGHPALAARFVRAYAAASGDSDVARLVPFYACYRACVRGKVASLKSVSTTVTEGERREAAERARAYFALAARCAWGAAEPVVIACCGLSGSGKTALAQTLARATGFAHVATDVLRVGVTVGAGDRYAPEAREATYEALIGEIDRQLAAGRSVIADATFIRREHRDRVARLAAQHRRRHVFVHCHAPEDVVRRRLDARPAEALSEARWETYCAQRAVWEALGAGEPSLDVDTGADLAAARAAAVRSLWPWREGRSDPAHSHGRRLE